MYGFVYYFIYRKRFMYVILEIEQITKTLFACLLDIYVHYQVCLAKMLNLCRPNGFKCDKDIAVTHRK